MEFHPISFWMRDRHQTHDALAGNLDVDVAVIGAGFTGLSAAKFLAQQGNSIAVVEQGIIGEGASGRNCGQIGAEIGRNLAALENDIGRDAAADVLSILRDAILHLESLIDDNGIDCDYVRSGNIFAGVHEAHRARVEKIASVARAHGFPVDAIDGAQVEALGLPPAVRCGFHDKTGGRLDPAKLVAGLARVALGSGDVTIFERTRVTGIEDGQVLTIHTDSGRIRCRSCVLATNAYSPQLGFLKRKILPAHVSVAVTQPLTDRQLNAVGWSGVGGMYTAHNVIENLRLTADRRILVGTKRVRVGFGNRHPRQNDPQVFGALQRVLNDRFPELDGIRLASGWTGRVAVTSDSVPVIGRTGSHKNIIYSAGYSGHGIAMSAYSGRHIAALHAGQPLGHASVLQDRRVLPVPPEPFAWLGATTLFAALSRQDAAVDRKAREHS